MIFISVNFFFQQIKPFQGVSEDKAIHRCYRVEREVGGKSEGQQTRRDRAVGQSWHVAAFSCFIKSPHTSITGLHFRQLKFGTSVTLFDFYFKLKSLFFLSFGEIALITALFSHQKCLHFRVQYTAV